MKIALCTELRNAEWFESRLRSLFDGDGQLVIDELWNEKQLSQADFPAGTASASLLRSPFYLFYEHINTN